MKTLTLCATLVALVFSSISAAAAVPTADVIAQAKAKCDVEFKDSVARRERCRSNIDALVAQERVAEAERVAKAAKDEAEATRAKLAKVEERVERAEAEAKKAAAAPAPTPTPVPAPAAPPVEVKKPAEAATVPPPATPPAPAAAPAPVAKPAVPTGAMGVPFVVTDMPARFVALTWFERSIHNLIEIHALRAAAQNLFGIGAANMVRIVVFVDGRQVAVAHPAGPGGVGFNEFYADVNNDGMPESMPYKGLDPAFVNRVFVSYQAGDRVQIVYLVPTGKMISIAGLPPQIVWGRAKSLFYDTLEAGVCNAVAAGGSPL